MLASPAYHDRRRSGSLPLVYGQLPVAEWLCTVGGTAAVETRGQEKASCSGNRLSQEDLRVGRTIMRNAERCTHASSLMIEVELVDRFCLTGGALNMHKLNVRNPL